MKRNMSDLDRILRFILGVIVGLVGVYYHSWWGLIAIPLLVTAIVNWCFIYAALGITSCKECGHHNKSEIQGEGHPQ